VDLDIVCGSLTSVFGLPCLAGEGITVPAHAYDSKRRQYLADAFLAVLRSLSVPDAQRLLGVTDVDLYAPGLNFVFGQAVMRGREAVISLVRLRNSFYGLPDDEALLVERTTKEAVHELAHTYGLTHCPQARCVMHFSNSLRDTDAKHVTFCPRCSAQLGALLHRQTHVHSDPA